MTGRVIGTCAALLLGRSIAPIIDQDSGGEWSVVAQEPSLVPPVQVSSRADLVTALQGSPQYDKGRLRFMTLAAQGRDLLPYLHAIVQDETENLALRVNALQVLGLMLDSSSVSIIARYASQPGQIQAWAQEALRYSPYPQACEVWRGVLAEGAGGTLMSLSGIGFCGTVADIPLLEAAMRRTAGGFGHQQAGRASLDRIHMPIAERYRGTDLEGNYPPTGRYRPPPRVADRLVAVLCGGPCRPGRVLLPRDVARLQGR